MDYAIARRLRHSPKLLIRETPRFQFADTQKNNQPDCGPTAFTGVPNKQLVTLAKFVRNLYKSVID